MSTILLTKDIVVTGSLEFNEKGMFIDGKQPWSWMIHNGMKDVTPISAWSYAAQFNLARSIK